ncbi:MAG: flavin reductase family protein [Clostridia bacterium]|nr:flavin reductase family protein [Clostridia bacterium]
MIGTVLPRPIAWVTTLGPEGPNAAPFSFFNCMGSNPPILVFAVADEGRQKDTVRNLDAVRECVVHVVSEDLAEAMNVCAIDFPYGVDELRQAGLTTAPSARVRPPRIAEAPVAMECTVHDLLRPGRSTYHIVIAEVVHLYVRDDLVDERLHVDVRRLRAVGRMAGSSWYVRTTDLFEIPRIRYSEWRERRER